AFAGAARATAAAGATAAPATATAAPGTAFGFENRADLPQRDSRVGEEGDPCDAGQVGQVVVAISAARALGFRHHAEAVVVPDAACTDPDDLRDLTDSHAPIINLDTATRSS